MTFTPSASDVYVASYPRSGTTWMQKILYHLLSGKTELEANHLDDVSPFFERAAQDGIDLDVLPARRLLKTHLHSPIVRRNPGQIVYVLRDGRDVLVSYYHFHVTYYGYARGFDAFFEEFLGGRVKYGSWFRHVDGWARLAGQPDVLLIHYEELMERFDTTITRIAQFLEVPFPEALLASIKTSCSFSAMSTRAVQFAPKEAPAIPGEAFLRRGMRGQWRERFSTEQVVRFETVATETLSLAARNLVEKSCLSRLGK